LQDGSFRPLGGRQLLHAKVRIIAASNIQLDELVRAGTFRADFMYRLRLFTIDIPPLRERSGDIGLLAENYVRKLNVQYRLEKYLDRNSIEALERYHWPGNVRELENVLHREFLLSDDTCLRILDPSCTSIVRLQPDAAAIDPDHAAADFNTAKARAICEFERAYLVRALQRNAGNVSAAARSCGKERRAFGKLLKKYGVDKDLYHQS
jgi:transcriptional regulator with GAF, ATPase, and Fis domain